MRTRLTDQIELRLQCWLFERGIIFLKADVNQDRKGLKLRVVIYNPEIQTRVQGWLYLDTTIPDMLEDLEKEIDKLREFNYSKEEFEKINNIKIEDND